VITQFNDMVTSVQKVIKWACGNAYTLNPLKPFHHYSKLCGWNANFKFPLGQLSTRLVASQQ